MYEIHVTVKPGQANALRAYVDEKFPTVTKFRVRVHHFVNHALPPVEDVMTGEACSGSLERAASVAAFRADQFRRAKFDVLRVKVEGIGADHRVVSGSEYYETHLRLLGWPAGSSPQVRGLLLSTSVHSGNLHGTVRSRTCTYEQHVQRVHGVARGLAGVCCQVVEPPRHEVVLLDSAPEHDARWEGAKRVKA